MVKNEGDIYLFCGDENFLKKEAEKAVIARLFPQGLGEINRDSCNAKDDYKAIHEALNTPPFLSNRQVVIIDDIETLGQPNKERFLAYLSHPYKYILLILRSNKTPLDNNFIEKISHYARTSIFRRPKGRELKSWICERLRRYKKTIETGALELFLELKETQDLAALSNDLEKLVIYKAEERMITKEDIRELIGKGFRKRVFELMDAVSFKDKNAALSLAHELSCRNKKDVHEMMGLMGWQLRRIWKAKRLLAKSRGEREIAQRLGIKSFRLAKFMNQVNHFTVPELKRDFKLLVDADCAIKTGYKKSNFVLEELVVSLCSP